MIDDDIGNGCNPGGDEDDHDPASIVVGTPTNPSIAIDKVDNNAANDEDGSVGNDTQENDSIFNVGESFSYTCTDENVTSAYTNSATVDAKWVTSRTSVTDTDTSPVLLDTPPVSSSSSSGGGWTSPQCGGIEINGSQVTCTWNSKAKSYKVVCGDRNNTVIPRANSAQTTSEIFDCGYNNDPESPDYNPQEEIAQCFVSGNNTSDENRITTTRFVCQQQPWTTTPGGGWSSNVCGNGVLEGGETCERAYVEIGNALVETPISNDSACRALGWDVKTVTSGNNQCLLPFDDNICNEAGAANQCRIKTVIPTEPNPERPNRTVPNDGDIIFSPSREGTSVNSDLTRKCKDIGTLYPFDEVFFTRAEITDYVSSTVWFGENETFRDTKLIVSLFHEGTEYKTAYFASTFDVRVTKPTIITVWGGTTYVKDTSEVASVLQVQEIKHSQMQLILKLLLLLILL